MNYEKLSINEVNLDFNNPRIKQWIEIYGDNVTSEGIALALSASAGNDGSSSYGVLKESIKVNRGIISPIIVNKESNGKMYVIEGNTRLQIYREFSIADPEGPWNEIIAIVYDNLPIERIHAIRLQSHLVGPRDWDPFSKAKYLNQLSNVDKMPMSTIISFCGGKGSEIRKLIDAYIDMVKYYFDKAEEYGFDPDPRAFSKFAEMQNRSIVDSLLVHKFTKDDFSKWVINGNIDNAQNVRKLPAILANANAKAQFLKTNITDACRFLNIDEKGGKGLKDATFDELVVELISRARKISFNEMKSLKFDPRYLQNKNNIYDLIDELNTITEFFGEE